GSRLAGVDEAARRSLGLEASVSEGLADVAEELRQPEYSTALGLLHYAVTGQDAVHELEKYTSFFRKISGLLNI
ncbi:MAG: hypothetical protein ABF320_02745, partial [Lentimonas sp.]